MDVAYPLRRHSAGLTLVELLTTCSVALLLTSLAVPAARSLQRYQAATTASNAVLAHLALARHAAVSNAVQVVLCPSSDGRHCTGGYDWSAGWLVFADPNGNRRPDSGERYLAVETRPPGGARILSSTGRRKVVYRRSGATAGTNVTFRICSDDSERGRRSVIVNITGRPKVGRHDASGRPIRCTKKTR